MGKKQNGNTFIEPGLRADIMRSEMESKNTLQNKGSIYVGTGDKTTIGSANICDTKELKISDNVVDTAATVDPNYGKVLMVGADGQLGYGYVLNRNLDGGSLSINGDLDVEGQVHFEDGLSVVGPVGLNGEVSIQEGDLSVGDKIKIGNEEGSISAESFQGTNFQGTKINNNLTDTIDINGRLYCGGFFNGYLNQGEPIFGVKIPLSQELTALWHAFDVINSCTPYESTVFNPNTCSIGKVSGASSTIYGAYVNEAQNPAHNKFMYLQLTNWTLHQNLGTPLRQQNDGYQIQPGSYIIPYIKNYNSRYWTYDIEIHVINFAMQSYTIFQRDNVSFSASWDAQLYCPNATTSGEAPRGKRFNHVIDLTEWE